MKERNMLRKQPLFRASLGNAAASLDSRWPRELSSLLLGASNFHHRTTTLHEKKTDQPKSRAARCSPRGRQHGGGD